MSRLVLALLARPSRLTESQLDKLADVFINIGTLFFGSMVVPYFVLGLDKPPILVLALGLVLSSLTWLFAINLVKGIKT